MSARIFVLSLAMGVVLCATDAAAQTPASALSLEGLEARALERHPAVREAAARVEEARGRAAQAGAWDNPTIGAVSKELRPRESPSGMYGGFIEQSFAVGGRRGAERTAATSAVAVREAELDTVRRRVRVAVRAAYYDLAAAGEQRAVTERMAAVADESVVIARQLMNVGLIDRPDLLDAEAEAARQRAAVASARVHEAGAWRRLALAAADPAMAAQTAPRLADAPVPVLDRERSLARVLAEGPELKAVEAEVARVRSGVDVERRLFSPDLTLRGEVGWNRELFGSRQEAKGWEYGVEAGLKLPLWNGNRNGIFAASAAVTAAESRLAVVRLDLESRFTSAFEEYERARATAEAYKADVLPKLEEALGLYLARYREMAAPYPQVLMAQRLLVNATEEYLGALGRAWQAAVRVEGLLVDEGGR